MTDVALSVEQAGAPANGTGTRMPPIPSPHPLGEMLPAMFADDRFTQRFTEGLDGTLAPVLVLLDCLSAYFDPEIAPPDFLEWLASWVGLTMDAHWPDDRRRALVRETVDLYRWQGTRHGLATQILLHTGVEPTIVEPGGVAWSEQPGRALPGTGGDEIVVSLDLPGHTPADAARLRAAVASVVPAHLRFRLEIGGATPPTGPSAPRSQPPRAAGPAAEAAAPAARPEPAEGSSTPRPRRTETSQSTRAHPAPTERAAPGVEETGPARSQPGQGGAAPDSPPRPRPRPRHAPGGDGGTTGGTTSHPTGGTEGTPPGSPPG